jgi:hypothetical protein
VWDRFFNDLLAQGWPAPFWYMLRVFYDGDSYPPLGLYFKFFDVAVRVFLTENNFAAKADIVSDSLSPSLGALQSSSQHRGRNWSNVYR